MKYPRTYHWPWSETVHKDDSVLVNPGQFVGQEVIITEKIDGSNTCIHNGEVYARSTTLPSHNGWHSMVRKHHGWKTVDKDIYIFGEDIYGVHSIEYNPVKEDETFMVFAIINNGIFLSWDNVCSVAAEYDMKTVPVIFHGKFDNVETITAFFKQNMGESNIGPEKEGFVMRMANSFEMGDFNRFVCKYVRPNHVQTDEHWTRNWKPTQINRPV